MDKLEKIEKLVPPKGPFVVIVGPTAVGKTKVSIDVAKAMDAEIVSADSMQIYERLNIGSAKPDILEQDGVKHHMLDCIPLDYSYSVAQYQSDARNSINSIIKRGRLPIVAGGTGLYVHALTYDIDFTRVIGDEEYRGQLETIAKEKGNEFLHNMLREKSQDRANDIHPNNVKRVIRALEILNDDSEKSSDKYEFEKPLPDIDFLIIGLNMDRQQLYDRINLRVDIMIENGLIDEVKGILASGYSKDLISLQGIGYKEIIEYLEGVVTLEQAIDNIKKASRRLAKKQITWFKRDKRIKWWDLSNLYYGRITNEIIDYINDWKVSLQ